MAVESKSHGLPHVRQSATIATWSLHRLADTRPRCSGDDRADSEDLGQGRAGGADRRGQLLLGLPQQGIDAAQVGWTGAGQVITSVANAEARQSGEIIEDDGEGFAKIVAFLEQLKVI